LFLILRPAPIISSSSMLAQTLQKVTGGGRGGASTCPTYHRKSSPSSLLEEELYGTKQTPTDNYTTLYVLVQILSILTYTMLLVIFIIKVVISPFFVSFPSSLAFLLFQLLFYFSFVFGKYTGLCFDQNQSNDKQQV
jgi:hypothetical protein